MALFHKGAQQSGVLVVLVQVEHVVGGGQHHLVALGEHHGLQHVAQLGNVGHGHAVAVAVEDVQGEGGHHGVAHGVLLVQEAGVGAGLHVEPGAPLVHQQAHLVLGVVAVHNLGVLGNYLIHEVGLAQGDVVILLGELRGGALVLPIVAGHGVVVEGEGPTAILYSLLSP